MNDVTARPNSLPYSRQAASRLRPRSGLGAQPEEWTRSQLPALLCTRGADRFWRVLRANGSRHGNATWHPCIFVPAGQLKAGQDFVITLSSEIIERCAVDRCERTTSINERILA
jgi:hypothetical protein